VLVVVEIVLAVGQCLFELTTFTVQRVENSLVVRHLVVRQSDRVTDVLLFSLHPDNTYVQRATSQCQSVKYK